jgi:chromosome partitioning protein
MHNGEEVAYCSARCQLQAVAPSNEVPCTSCGRRFVPEFAYQSAVSEGQRQYFCSMECRQRGPLKAASIQRLAVYNVKGGTGKTTTAISLSAALAALGAKTLLVDGDPQGSVAVSLGQKYRRGLYQIVVLGAAAHKCTVAVRENFDVILSDRSLAGAEVFLAGRPERHRVVRDRLGVVDGYDMAVIDCSPSVGLLSQNALRWADSVLIPVSCDYLGVIGLQQALGTIQDLERRTGHRLRVVGVLPTFHDGRLRVCREAMETLRKYFGQYLLPPVRVNAKLRETPASKTTIFEHAPRSSGARDYFQLAHWLMRNHMACEPSAEAVAAMFGTSSASSQAPAQPA